VSSSRSFGDGHTSSRSSGEGLGRRHRQVTRRRRPRSRTGLGGGRRAFDARLRASHAEGMDPVGYDVAHRSSTSTTSPSSDPSSRRRPRVSARGDSSTRHDGRRHTRVLRDQALAHRRTFIRMSDSTHAPGFPIYASERPCARAVIVLQEASGKRPYSRRRGPIR